MWSKPFLFSLLSIFFFFCKVVSQNATISGIEARLNQLREKDRVPDLIAGARSDTLSWPLHQLTDYLYVETEAAGSSIVKTKEWYFDKKHLFYAETTWWDTQKHQLLYSEKIYLDKGKLFAWINSENSFVNSNSDEFRKMDTILRESAKKILEAKEE